MAKIKKKNMDQLKIAFKELESWKRDDLEVLLVVHTAMLISFSEITNMIVSIVQVIIQIILVHNVSWNNNKKTPTDFDLM